MKAVMSSEIEPAACRIEQQCLVFRVEQGWVSRVRVQSCDYGQKLKVKKKRKRKKGPKCASGVYVF